MVGWLCDALLTCSLSCLHHISLEQEANRLEMKSLSLKARPQKPTSCCWVLPPEGWTTSPILHHQLSRKHSNTGPVGGHFLCKRYKAFGHSSLWPAVTLLLVFFWVKGNPFFSSPSFPRSPNLRLLSLSLSKTCTYFFHNIYFD